VPFIRARVEPGRVSVYPALASRAERAGRGREVKNGGTITQPPSKLKSIPSVHSAAHRPFLPLPWPESRKIRERHIKPPTQERSTKTQPSGNACTGLNDNHPFPLKPLWTSITTHTTHHTLLPLSLSPRAASTTLHTPHRPPTTTPPPSIAGSRSIPNATNLFVCVPGEPFNHRPVSFHLPSTPSLSPFAPSDFRFIPASHPISSTTYTHTLVHSPAPPSLLKPTEPTEDRRSRYLHSLSLAGPPADLVFVSCRNEPATQRPNRTYIYPQSV